MLQTISIIVSGKVQGVYFRHSTREKAKEIGITGFSQNRPDNTVFIVATGTKEQLDKLVAWCHTGPPKAQVTDVTVEQTPFQPFEEFVIRRS